MRTMKIIILLIAVFILASGLTHADEGLGGKKDQAKARSLLKKACEDGHAMGCYLLGAMWLTGLGGPEDKAQTRLYYHKACEGGEAKGCFNLGLLWLKGEGGPRDYTKAFALCLCVLARLKFLDGVLVVGSRAVSPPDIFRRGVFVVGDHHAESILLPSIQFPEQTRLPSRRLGWASPFSRKRRQR